MAKCQLWIPLACKKMVVGAKMYYYYIQLLPSITILLHHVTKISLGETTLEGLIHLHIST